MSTKIRHRAVTGSVRSMQSVARQQRATPMPVGDGAVISALLAPGLIDPYLTWAEQTKFAYLGGDSVEWFPVLIELAQGSSRVFAQSIANDVRGDEFRISSIYRAPTNVPEGSRFCSLHVTRNFLVENLGTREYVQKHGIRRFELGTPVLAAPPPAKAKFLRPLALGTKAPHNVVVAVIDDGLAFAHARFRDAYDNTRFRYFWNQDGATLNPPPNLGWGQEYDRAQINAWMDQCRHSGMVDEDAVYRLAGQVLVARRAKHGTHVMDIACGLEPNEVVPSSPYLIGVQLPHWSTIETSGAFLTWAVIDAITYILKRAHDIAAQEGTTELKIVVNLSYGAIAGPHDGSSLLEAFIDETVRQHADRLTVVLPAGNSMLARCHARFSLPAGAVQRMQWRVQPDDRACSFMEIWTPPIPNGQPEPPIEVRVTTPTGATSPWLGTAPPWSWPSNSDVRFILFNVGPVSYPAGTRTIILLAIAPTSAIDPPVPTAPAGNWIVDVRAAGAAINDIDAWIQRGDTPFGYPLRGRQSRFEDPAYVHFDLAGRLKETDDPPPAHVIRAATLNAFATGSEPVVIGGFRRSDLAASRYSGAGPIITWPGQLPYRDGPDAAGVADDSPVLHGVIAAGTRSGSRFAMSGTSVAAPQITRMLAHVMTIGVPGDRVRVQNVALAQELPRPLPHPPATRIGAGRIDLPERCIRVKRRP